MAMRTPSTSRDGAERMPGTADLITLAPSSGVPPYEQVRSQLAARITAGALAPGTKLPTVRRLAEDLALAVNTVARAYRELETAGLVETRGRGGTVVTAGGDQVRSRVQDAAQRYAELVQRHGLGPDEAFGYIRAALDRA
jgi:DNA-binding transcriptional regulator YhcF (GntR family)